MKTRLFIFCFFFTPFIYANEVIYFSDSAGLSYLNQISLPELEDDDSNITLGNYDQEVQQQEIIKVFNQIIYLKELTQSHQTRLKVINLNEQKFIKEILIEGVFFDDYYALNNVSNKLYIVTRSDSEQITITKINTQQHNIEETFTIGIPDLQFNFYSSNNSKKIAFNPLSDTLYFFERERLISVDLNSQDISYTTVSSYDSVSGQYHGNIDSIQLSGNNNRLFLNRTGGQIKVFDVATKSIDKTISFKFESSQSPIIVSADGSLIYSVSNKAVQVFDSNSQQISRIAIDIPKYFVNVIEKINSLHLSADESRLYILYDIQANKTHGWSTHSNFLIVDLNKKQLIAKVEIQDQVEEFLGFSSDNHYAYFSTYHKPNYIHSIDLQSQTWFKSINIGLQKASMLNDKILLFDSSNIELFPAQYFTEQTFAEPFFTEPSHTKKSDNTVGANILTSFPDKVARMTAHPTLPFVYLTQAYHAVRFHESVMSRFYPNNQLSIINTLSKEIIAAIEVGKYPLGIAIDTHGQYAYVANCGDNSVSIIDIQKYESVYTIPVGNEPVGIAINPALNEIYITQQGDNSIAVLDPITRMTSENIALSAAPGNIVLNSQGSKAYITTKTGNTLLVVDLLSKQEVNSLPISDHLYDDSNTYSCLSEPVDIKPNEKSISFSNRGISLSKDGSKLFTANAENQLLVIINTQTDQVEEKISYSNLMTSHIENYSIAPQVSSEKMFIAKNIESGQTELALNLFDQQNILLTNFNLLPSFNINDKTLFIPEIMADNRKHMASLKLLDNDSVNVFRLTSSQRVIELPLVQGKEPIYSDNSGEAVIPDLLVLGNGELEHCQVALKKIESELFLFKVQDARAYPPLTDSNCTESSCTLALDAPFCKGLQSQAESIALGLCGGNTGIPCINSDLSENVRISWTDFWDIGTLSFFASIYPNQGTQITISGIEDDGQGGLWIANNLSLTHLKANNQWQALTDGAPGFATSDIALGPTNEPWGVYSNNFGLKEDIYQYSSTGQWLKHQSGLTDYNGTLPTKKIYVDNQGIIWVIGGGIYYDDYSESGLYPVRDNTIGRRDSSGEWQYYASELLHIQIDAIHEDGQGGLWIGQGNSLIHLSSDGIFTTVASLDPQVLDHVFYILHLDEQGTLWTVNENGLASLDTQGNWRVYTPEPGKLPSSSISGIQSDQQGGLWISTNKGLAHFSNEKWTIFNTSNSSLFENHIRFIKSDGDSGLWLVTKNNTLAHLKLLNSE